MSSRRYVKRIWQVPKDRGPVEYLATLVCKQLRKHGWPVEYDRPRIRTGNGKAMVYQDNAFLLQQYGGAYDLPPDLLDAIAICVRIVAKTYQVDMTEDLGIVTIHRRYRVTEHGKLKEIPP